MTSIKSNIFGSCFDIDRQVTGSLAAAFKKAGNVACLRYLPRTPKLIPGNLTASEKKIILAAGLSLGAVQHVPEPGWVPSAGLGASYGEYAAAYAKSIGLLLEMNLWADLEEVAPQTSTQSVIDYCTAWYKAVSAGGYTPGLYVGWNIVLDPRQLYENLPFRHYWNAYNGSGIAVRGCQLLQHNRQTLNGVAYDPNTSQADHLGGTAIWMSPS